MKRHQTPWRTPHAIWATCQASSFSIRPPHWAPRTSSLATAGPINKRSSLQPARDGPGGAQEASSSSATRSSHDYDPSSATSLLSRWTLKTWRRRRRYPRNYPRLTLDFLSSSVFGFCFLVWTPFRVDLIFWKLAISVFSKLKNVSSPCVVYCPHAWQQAQLTRGAHCCQPGMCPRELEEPGDDEEFFLKKNWRILCF